MLDLVLHGEPCIDAYNTTYTSALAIEFDPITRTITNRAMC